MVINLRALACVTLVALALSSVKEAKAEELVIVVKPNGMHQCLGTSPSCIEFNKAQLDRKRAEEFAEQLTFLRSQTQVKSK